MQNTIQLTPQESKLQVQRDWLAEGVPVVQMFQNEEFGAIEVMMIDGKPHFPATECAEILGYATPRHAVSRHCKGGTKRAVLTNGGEQEKLFIPEGDLYLSAGSWYANAVIWANANGIGQGVGGR